MNCHPQWVLASQMAALVTKVTKPQRQHSKFLCSIKEHMYIISKGGEKVNV